MARKLFCELCPLTYQISVIKGRIIRTVSDFLSGRHFANIKSEAPLPYLIYRHSSLIRRKLGNADMDLQEGKAINLKRSAPNISHVLIRPGEEFSFWKLVGHCTPQKGYRQGLIINSDLTVGRDFGGGLCQFTNLIHWMVLHTPLTITEHHHHDSVDLFPDYGRQIPFGTGTSVFYNYVDYRFKNETQDTYQLITYVTEEYLCGELRCSSKPDYKYHIKCENEFFSEENSIVYRNSQIFREKIDPRTGNLVFRECIKQNHARVLYEINPTMIINKQQKSTVM